MANLDDVMDRINEVSVRLARLEERLAPAVEAVARLQTHEVDDAAMHARLDQRVSWIWGAITGAYGLVVAIATALLGGWYGRS